MNKTKKLLSILLALMMMLSVVPFYASAAPIALTNRNVEIVVPSVSPTEINYGQPISDVTITGGEMWYIDGTGVKTKVEGYFIHRSTAVIPPANDAYEPMFKFVPTDSNYTCSATFRSGNTTYTGTWPTIKVKAEAVATLAEAPVASSLAVGGKKIYNSVLSGGKVVDGEGNDITALGKWQWPDTTIVVNESGTYTAVWKATNNDYDPISVDVYIAVEAVQTKTYFTDENGNETVPEIRWTVYSALSDTVLASHIEKLTANCGEFSAQVKTSNIDTTTLGEYECTARITPKNEYYSTEDLTFKFIVEPLEVSPYFTAYGNDTYMITTGDYTKKPRGTYDLYVDGELVMEDIKYQEEFTWRPEKSGTYNLKAVYNPVENDTFKVNDAVREMELMLTWKINCINCGAYDYMCGETATVNHSLGDKFGGWVFYDENGNEFTPENVVADESTSSVKFTMPDFSLTVEAKEKGAAGSDTSGGIDDIFGNLGDLTEGDSDNPFENIINNLVAFFKNIINTIKNFFRGIGDMT